MLARDLTVSADRSVFATVDQSRGPTDDGADLADLDNEVMPLLQGVSDERPRETHSRADEP